MDAAKKLCAICKRNDVPDGWRVCEECKDMSNGVATILEPKVVMSQCKICKKLTPADELKNARHGWCYACTSDSMRKARALKQQEKTPIGNSDTILEIPDAHQNGPILTIDFSRHNQVLERILQLAMDELRTPEAQVLYWLINNVR